MKKTYIIPALNIRKISLENMIATSFGPQTSSSAADESFGMDAKGDQYGGGFDDWGE